MENIYESKLYNKNSSLFTIFTKVAACVAWKVALSNPKKPEKIVIIFSEKAFAKHFFKTCKEFLYKILNHLWGENCYKHRHIIKKDLINKFKLFNGSEIILIPNYVDALRGYTPTYIILDEKIYNDKESELYAVLMSSLITGGKMIVTPKF